MKPKAFLDLLVHVIYNYFSKGPKSIIAYETALMFLSLTIFLNILTVLKFCNIEILNVIPLIESHGRFIKILSSGIYGFPLYFLLNLIFKRKKIIKNNYTKTQIKKGETTVILYLLTTLVLIIMVFKFN